MPWVSTSSTACWGTWTRSFWCFPWFLGILGPTSLASGNLPPTTTRTSQLPSQLVSTAEPVDVPSHKGKPGLLKILQLHTQNRNTQRHRVIPYQHDHLFQSSARVPAAVYALPPVIVRYRVLGCWTLWLRFIRAESWQCVQPDPATLLSDVRSSSHTGLSPTTATLG